jgi:hypothetical protein
MVDRIVNLEARIWQIYLGTNIPPKWGIRVWSELARLLAAPCRVFAAPRLLDRKGNDRRPAAMRHPNVARGLCILLFDSRQLLTLTDLAKSPPSQTTM